MKRAIFAAASLVLLASHLTEAITRAARNSGHVRREHRRLKDGKTVFAYLDETWQQSGVVHARSNVNADGSRCRKPGGKKGSGKKSSSSGKKSSSSGKKSSSGGKRSSSSLPICDEYSPTPAPTTAPTLSPVENTAGTALPPTPAQSCHQVANGSGPTDGTPSEFVLVVTFDAPVASVEEGIAALQSGVAPGLTGCTARRRLQSQKPENVVFSAIESSEPVTITCDSNGSATASCIQAEILVQVYPAEADTEEFRLDLLREIQESGTVQSVAVEKVEDEGPVASSRGELDVDQGAVSTSVVVGVAMTGALLLLTILFIGSRRRVRSGKSVTTAKYVDVEDEPDIWSNEPRGVHIVGEENSVMTSWSTNPTRLLGGRQPIGIMPTTEDGTEVSLCSGPVKDTLVL